MKYIQVRIPEGDLCYEESPHYICPFWSTSQFDLSVISRCGFLVKEWKGASCIRNASDFNKHNDCPYFRKDCAMRCTK